MENNLLNIEKKAIDAALNNNWEDALKFNKLILKNTPNNIGAKIRLGKALIQTKNFKEAIDTFNEVLKVDPINKIALKNLNVAKEKKVSLTNLKADKLIIEPGTTTELALKVNKKIPFEVGEILDISIEENNKVALVYKDKPFIFIDNIEVSKVINKAIKESINIEISVIKIKEGSITVLLTSDTPIFKSEKQTIKPYTKKGIIEIEEPELDMGTDQND